MNQQQLLGAKPLARLQQTLVVEAEVMLLAA
jgi:hypothetical protein